MSLGGLALSSTTAWAGNEEEVACPGESIHQEPIFKASRKRVYDALTDTKQFNNVTQLSAAMQSGMPPGAAPTQISREAGGAFALFGGHIVGRHIELVPNERIVQAWRVATWDPGVYSIAKFALVEQGSGTKLHREIRREGRGAATWAKKLENRPAWTKAPCYSGLVVSTMAATACPESQLPGRALIVIVPPRWRWGMYGLMAAAGIFDRGILVASLRMTPGTLQHHAKRCGGARAD